MAGKIKEIKSEFLRQIKIVSMTLTVLVHLSYIGYLRFALRHGIGNRLVNITLALATAAFLVVYLIFSLFAENKRNVKRTKKVYRIFKLVTKIFTVATAVYTVFIAAGSSSPLVILFATANAILLAIRLVFELIASLIGLGARRVKAKFAARRKEEIPTESNEPTSEEICEITLE